MSNHFYIPLFLLLSSFGAWAQNPVFRVINNLNGLSSNSIYDIKQDNRGFVWIAHNKGLSRYDGRSMVNFKNGAAKGKALSNILFEQGRVWCQDFSGNFYYTQSDSLVKEQRFGSSGYFGVAMFDTQHQFINTIKDTLHILDIKHNTKRKIPLYHGFINFLLDTKQEIEVFSGGKLLDLNGNVLKEETKSNIADIFFVNKIKDKYYGISKEKHPYITPLFTQKNYKSTLKKGLFIQAVHTLENEIWVCTSTGAYCFDENFEPKYGGFCFFEGTSISKVICDKEGNYWFSTLNRGLYFVTDLNVRLYNYQNSAITSLAINEMGNELLVGTEKNELLSFGRDKSFFRRFQGETTHEILGIKRQDNTTFCLSEKLYALDKKYHSDWSKKLGIKDFTFINEKLLGVAFSTGITLITVDNKKGFVPKWLRSEKDKWEEASPHYSLILGERGRAVCLDERDSTFYAATSKGLYYFSPKGKGRILLNGSDVFATEIKVIDNEVCIATFDKGLLRIKNNQTIEPFLSIKEGLFSDVVYHFQKKGTKFWLIEDGMLQSYDLLTQKICNYSFNDGLPRAEIRGIEIYQGKVYLATTEGLVVFDESLNTQNNTAPNIAITSIKANDNELGITNNFSLEATQNNVDIFFSILSYRGEGNISIRYNINNGTWLPMQQDARVLSLSALSPGTYTIQLHATNEDGVSTQQPLLFTFTIATPWYKRWYVLGIVIGVLLLLMYQYFKRRINLIEKNNALVAEKLQLEQEVHKSVLASIKSQMNPHFLFNALNTIQAYIYTNDKENASIYLGKFSDLTRSILDMSNKERIPLSEEVRALRLYLDLEKLRFEDTLNYEIKIDEDIDENWIHIPSMLIQPYLENAIKHGLLHKKNERKVTIEFQKQDHKLCVIIDDNGVGRKRAAELNILKNKQQHAGFALTANQKRLDILNYDTKRQIVMNITDKIDEFGNPTGTRVTILIPFEK